MTKFKFNTIKEAIEDIANGKMVIVVDDEDRENEGDLLMAAHFATPENINFMIKKNNLEMFNSSCLFKSFRS